MRFMAFGGHPNGRGHWGSLKAPKSHVNRGRGGRLALKNWRLWIFLGLSCLTKVPELEQWMDGWMNGLVQCTPLQSKCAIQTGNILVFLFRNKTLLIVIVKLVCHIKVSFKTRQ